MYVETRVQPSLASLLLHHKTAWVERNVPLSPRSMRATDGVQFAAKRVRRAPALLRRKVGAALPPTTWRVCEDRRRGDPSVITACAKRLLSQLSLCLSRACLGKLIVFSLD